MAMFLWRRKTPVPAQHAAAPAASTWDYKVGLPIIPPDHDASLTLQVTSKATSQTGGQNWEASYSQGGHTARFIIEFDRSDRTEDHGIPMKFGKGRILSRQDSDNASLLPALGTALGGTVPTNITKQPELPFDYVHFGDNMSPIAGGGFAFNPSGDWTAMKLFFDGMTEDDSATVYFSLNPVAKEAQFSMSNSEYGDPILRHLATVL